jgi:hypothetical protein
MVFRQSLLHRDMVLDRDLGISTIESEYDYR